MAQIRGDRLRQLLRGGRHGALVQPQRRVRLPHPPKLDHHVLAARQHGHGVMPVGHRPLADGAVGPQAEGRTGMVADDRRLRKGAGQISQLRQLRVVLPGVKGQSVGRQARKALTKAGIEIRPRRGVAVALDTG